VDPSTVQLLRSLGLTAVEILSVIAAVTLYFDNKRLTRQYEKMLEEMVSTQTAIAVGLGIKLPERKGEKDE
jgi:hypothetical protein